MKSDVKEGKHAGLKPHHRDAAFFGK